MEKAAYGPFDFAPIVDRPKLSWDGRGRIAVWVVPNVEFFPLNYGMPGDHQERPTPSPEHPDVRRWCQRDYGARVGIWRLIDLLSKYGIRGTVALNSDVCSYYPRVVEAMTQAGWEMMGHAKTNVQYLTEVDPAGESALIQDCLSIIQDFTGRRPEGWLGPGLAETWNTLDHLAAAGIKYVCDWVNDDQPYWMRVKGGRIASVPYSFEINDSAVLFRQQHTAEDFVDMICRQFDVLYEESSDSGRVMAISLHPYISGVPHRARSLERAFRHITSHQDVWLATGAEIYHAFASKSA